VEPTPEAHSAFSHQSFSMQELWMCATGLTIRPNYIWSRTWRFFFKSRKVLSISRQPGNCFDMALLIFSFLLRLPSTSILCQSLLFVPPCVPPFFLNTIFQSGSFWWYHGLIGVYLHVGWEIWTRTGLPHCSALVAEHFATTTPSSSAPIRQILLRRNYTYAILLQP